MSNQFTGAWVRRMRFHDHRISSCERGGGISSGHGKCQGKITGAKDCNRTERTEHGADVRTRQWLAVGQWRIDSRIHPRAFFYDFREETKLVGGAGQFAPQTRFG